MGGAAYLDEVRRQFRGHRRLAEGAWAQIAEEAWFAEPVPGTNSLAVVVKHLAGNLRSRWTDFLTADGEKPDRHRDGEFELTPADTKTALITQWEAGWAALETTLASLTPDDLARTVTIRSQPHSVVQAIQRSLAHAAYHVGQIVYLAKCATGERWQSLSVPRGKTEEFNAAIRQKYSKGAP